MIYKINHRTSQKIVKPISLFSLSCVNNFTYSSPQILRKFILNARDPISPRPHFVVKSNPFSIFVSPSIATLSRARRASSHYRAMLDMLSRFWKSRNRLKLKTRTASLVSDGFCGSGFPNSGNPIPAKNFVNGCLRNSGHFENLVGSKHRLIKTNNFTLFCCACFILCISWHVQNIAMCAEKVNAVNSVSDSKPIDVNRLCHAIFLAEGGDKARVPYGVLSVKVKDKADARRITITSINNNIKRWEKAGKPGTFIDFMANRWCPVASDPIGNRNWRKNVAAIYNQSK